jgi:hypothetical protein
VPLTPPPHENRQADAEDLVEAAEAASQASEHERDAERALSQTKSHEQEAAKITKPD